MTTDDLPTGLFLRAALLCERVLVEADNVKSIIRMIDQVTQTRVGADAPEGLPPGFTYPLTLFVSLKAGRAQGRMNYVIRMEPPNGIRKVVGQGSMNFPGAPNQGIDLMANLQIEFEQEGLYWFDLEIDEHVLTRMPLQVLYQRVIPGSTPPAP